jgi:hypothetical protein
MNTLRKFLVKSTRKILFTDVRTIEVICKISVNNSFLKSFKKYGYAVNQISRVDFILVRHKSFQMIMCTSNFDINNKAMYV